MSSPAHDWTALEPQDVADLYLAAEEKAAGAPTLVLPEPVEVYRRDPLLWAEHALDVSPPTIRWSLSPEYEGHAWDADRDPLARVAEILAGADGAPGSVAVSSATGTGKTFFSGALALWWLDCWEDSQVVVVAPTESLLQFHSMKEIQRFWPRFKQLHPAAELLEKEIRMRPGQRGWGLVAFVCGTGADEEIAGRARGFHAERLLFVLEECNAIHAAILAAIKYTCVSPYNLRVGLANPDSETDGLAQLAAQAGVTPLRCSGLDHPNVVKNDPSFVPGATSRPALEAWAKDDPEGTEGRVYCSRARGIPPVAAESSLFRKDWIEHAMNRSEEDRVALRCVSSPAIGADLSNSEAGDKAAFARGIGAELVELDIRACSDANKYAREVLYPFVTLRMVHPRRIGVDSISVGAGAVNELKRLGCSVVGLNGSARSWEDVAERDELFVNLRAQLFWQLRKDLQRGRLALPRDPELLRELMAHRLEVKNGKTGIGPKDEVKKRLGGRSPDRADAVVYWNFVRQFSAGATFSGIARAVAF